MQRVWSAIMVLFAVLALTAPTLASGYAALSQPAPHRHQTGPAVSSILNTVVKPCQAQGGKRVLPCQVDQAILGLSARNSAPTQNLLRIFANERLPEGRAGEPSLPPPRSLS